MTDTYEKCSCGARQKSKCVKESGMGSGKMCLKSEQSVPHWSAVTVYPEGSIVQWYDGTIVKSKYTVCGGSPGDWYDPTKTDKYGNLVDSLYINFRETLNGGFCADIDYEPEAWQKVLADWEGFKENQE